MNDAKKNNSKPDSLLVKILNGTASKEEILFFSEWIKDYQNEFYFDRFKEMWHVSVDEEYKKNNLPFNNSERFNEFIKKSRQKDRVKKSLSLAASFAIAASVILFVVLKVHENNSGTIKDQSLANLNFSRDSVKVEIYNGKFVHKLKDKTHYTALDGVLTQKIDTIIKKQSLTKSYNSVTTPSGERVVMALPDGSKVYLTANSYLRYPVEFGKDKREVNLVGRAYFEVKKSSVPFIVNTSDMNIEVLGTSFDVESRYNSQNSSVILVEGSVKVFADGKTQIIHPDEQISLHRITREIVVKNVDSKLLTMWRDGVLIVNGQSFDELIDNLSSWYGVEIVNNTSVSMNEKFNGRFDREDIKVALDAISISAKIKYKVINGKLILEDRQ